jgi:hypothetical protein
MPGRTQKYCKVGNVYEPTLSVLHTNETVVNSVDSIQKARECI